MENAGIRSNIAVLDDYFGDGAHEQLEEQLKQKEELLDSAYKKLQAKRLGAKVFCVGCGAQKRTLRKWHNSYLCSECYKIMENAGEEKFIKALEGKES